MNQNQPLDNLSEIPLLILIVTLRGPNILMRLMVLIVKFISK